MRAAKSLLAVLFMLGAGFLAPCQGPCTACAAEPKAGNKAEDSLDDELLKGLGETAEDAHLPDGKHPPAKKPADQHEDSTPAPQQRPKAKPAKRPSTPADLDDELLKGLGDGEDIKLGGKPASDEEDGDGNNPLSELERRMRDVESRIAEAQSDETTQRMQNKIVDDLSRIIKELQKRKKSSSSSSSSKQNQQTAEREKVDQPDASEPADAAGGQETASNQPAKDSSDAMSQRKSESPDAAQLGDALKDIWGQLPAHLRQQMEQYAKEELLPKYELQIEEYFRALARGQQEGP
jgi:hypothetical protein